MQNRSMMVILSFILMVCGVDLGCQEQHGINELLAEIKKHFAPDKRVAWWDVRAEPGDKITLIGETNLPLAKDSLIHRLKAEGIAYRDRIRVYTPKPALINVSVCNIRSQPKHSAELATQSLMGTLIKIYKQESGWHYVQTPEGYLGWLDQGAFVALDETKLQQWWKSEKVVVVTSGAQVRSSASQAVISDVAQGNILVKLDGVDGEVFHVALPDGRHGVIEKSMVVSYRDFLTPPSSLVSNIISTAHSFMGRPYLWGGTSSRAMDCSGFTKTVFYLNGLVLPRDASQQVWVGDAIDTDTTLKNLLPGDFLFFGRKASRDVAEKITHVGIYLGDGQMIHASEMVRVQSLRRNDPNFAENRLLTFVRAKRMLSQVGKNGVLPLTTHPSYHSPD